MFIDNKYTALYFRLTSTPDTLPYTEKHHIIPRSLGGSDDPSNLVALSARKHFLCHYLLTKMLKPNTAPWYKMVKAVMMMTACNSNQARVFNSRLYEATKQAFAVAQSASQTGSGNSQYGTRWVNKDGQDFKVRSDEHASYITAGYLPGKHKEPKPPKQPKVKVDNSQQEIAALRPYLERYLKGESLRQLAPEYGKSYVWLQSRLKLHFADQLTAIKPRTNKR